MVLSMNLDWLVHGVDAGLGAEPRISNFSSCGHRLHRLPRPPLPSSSGLTSTDGIATARFLFIKNIIEA